MTVNNRILQFGARHGLACVLLAAVLACFLVRIPALTESRQWMPEVFEESGGYDLTDSDLWENGSVILPSGASYYPNQLIAPEALAGAIATDSALLEETGGYF